MWDVCRRVCDVYRHDIGAGTTTRIPTTLRGRYQYRPSVTADGTVYFVHSGLACGQNVRLVRQPLGGGRRRWCSSSRRAMTVLAKTQADPGCLERHGRLLRQAR